MQSHFMSPINTFNKIGRLKTLLELLNHKEKFHKFTLFMISIDLTHIILPSKETSVKSSQILNAAKKFTKLYNVKILRCF